MNVINNLEWNLYFKNVSIEIWFLLVIVVIYVEKEEKYKYMESFGNIIWM